MKINNIDSYFFTSQNLFPASAFDDRQSIVYDFHTYPTQRKVWAGRALTSLLMITNNKIGNDNNVDEHRGSALTDHFECFDLSDQFLPLGSQPVLRGQILAERRQFPP